MWWNSLRRLPKIFVEATVSAGYLPPKEEVMYVEYTRFDILLQKKMSITICSRGLESHAAVWRILKYIMSTAPLSAVSSHTNWAEGRCNRLCSLSKIWSMQGVSRPRFSTTWPTRLWKSPGKGTLSVQLRQTLPIRWTELNVSMGRWHRSGKSGSCFKQHLFAQIQTQRLELGLERK